jgi:hypothetical protein
VTHGLTVSQPEPGALTLASESAESETARQAGLAVPPALSAGRPDSRPSAGQSLSLAGWQPAPGRCRLRGDGHSDSDGSLKFSGWLLSLPVLSQTEPD